MKEVLVSVHKGLARAKKEFNERIQDKDEPTYEYGIIVCAIRAFFPGMSPYYTAIGEEFKGMSQGDLEGIASLRLARAAVDAKEKEGIPVVAVDLAGAELGHKASEHVKAFFFAHRHFLGKTVHAGEGFGPESIRQAIRDLYAERIGHGFNLFSTELVTSDKNKEKAQEYVARLVKYVSDRRVTMEVCLTSNQNTMPHLALSEHPFGKMVEEKVSATICTDNRLVSNTTTIKELTKAVTTFKLTPDQLRNLIMTGFKRSFFPKSYVERRRYLQQTLDFYNRTCREHGVPLGDFKKTVD